MTDLQRDQLVAAVFATTAGKRLIEDVQARGATCLTLADIAAAIARARRTWSTANPETHE